MIKLNYRSNSFRLNGIQYCFCEVFNICAQCRIFDFTVSYTAEFRSGHFVITFAYRVMLSDMILVVF